MLHPLLPGFSWRTGFLIPLDTPGRLVSGAALAKVFTSGTLDTTQKSVDYGFGSSIGRRPEDPRGS
jgi:hypothetical protein